MTVRISVTPAELAKALASTPTDFILDFPDPLPAGALPALEKLLASPAMSRVTSLDCSRAHEGDDVTHEIRDYSDTMLQDTTRTWHGAPVIAALLAGRFTSLKQLKLVEINLDSPTLTKLLDAIPPLEALDLSENPIDDKALKAIASSPHAKSLRRLGLSKCAVTAAGLKAIASLPLTDLNLDFCELDGEALDVVLRAPFNAGASLVCCLKALTSVDALVDSAWLAKQTELELCHAKLGTKALIKLFSSPALAKLQRLDLDHLKVAGAAAALAKNPHLTQLEELSLSLSNLDIDGAAAIAASPRFPRLARLKLGYNSLGDDGVKALLADWKLTALKSLDLTSNDITDKGARLLAASPHLARLESLNVHWNKIGDDGAVALALTPIPYLDVGSNAVGKKGQKALETRKPPPPPKPKPAPAALSDDGWDAVFNAAPKDRAKLAPEPLPRGFDIDDREIRSRTTLEGHEGGIKAWDAANGVIATVGQDKTIRIWDAATGDQLRYITLTEPRSCLAVSPDGSLVAATKWNPYEHRLTVYNTATGDERYAVGVKMRSCVFSPDGTLLCGGAYDGTVSLWNATTGALVSTLHRHRDPADFVEFSLDGKFVRSVDFQGKELVHPVAKGAKGKPEWKRVHRSIDGRWELRGPKDLPELFDAGRRVGILVGHEGIEDARFWNRTLITLGADLLSVRLWDLLPAWTRKDIEMARSRKSASWAFVAAVLEKRYSVAPPPPPPRAVTAEEIRSGHPLHTVPSADWEAIKDRTIAPLAPLAVAARLLGRPAFASPALLIERSENDLDPPVPAELPKLQMWERLSTTVVSPDGRRMARALDAGEVETFDARAALLGRLKLDRDHATQLLFAPDGLSLALGLRSARVEIYDVALKERRFSVHRPSKGINDWISSMAFSPDGRVLATHSYEGRTVLWDAQTGAERAAFTTHGDGLAFSGDSARFVCAAGVIDAASGRIFARPKIIGSVFALSHDGRLLASAGSSVGIHVHHVDADAPVVSIPAKEWWVQRLAFVEGRLIARATAAYRPGPEGAHVWELLDFQPLGLFTKDDVAFAKTRTEPAWKFVAELLLKR